jgi:glycosyltransferase involved in cell wall biosynthesis
MRILHLASYSPFGGVESYTLDLYQELEARGHENVVLFDGHVIDGLTRPGRLTEKVTLSGPRGKAAAESAVRAQTLAALRRYQPSVAITHTTASPLVGEVFVDSVPTVHFAHTYDGICASGALYHARTNRVCELAGTPNWQCILHAYTSRCNTRRPVVLAEMYRRSRSSRPWLSRVDALVCGSQFVASRHHAAGFDADLVHVAPYPVPSRSTPPIPAGERSPTVVFAGRLVESKGLLTLLEALRRVRGDITLIVAGDGHDRPRLEAATRELGLAERTSFLGALPRESVRELFARASLVVLPSLWPEPMGIVGPEALDSGTPVIASDIGGVREWLIPGVTGLLFPPGDADCLARLIDELVDDESMRAHLGMQGRDLVARRFSIHAHTEQMLSVVERAVAHRASTRSE